MSFVIRRPHYGSVPSDGPFASLPPASRHAKADAAQASSPVVLTAQTSSSEAEATPTALAPYAVDLRPFGKKLHVYAKESVNGHYGVANGFVLGGMVGMGVANGGYMILLKGLGENGSSLPVVGFMTLTAFSMMLSGASKTFTSHQRDNQDIAMLGDAPDDTTAEQYCRYYVQCGLATASTNGALLLGSAAFARGAIPANALLGVSVVAKSIEACLKGVELGYWSCIKTHLGDPVSQRYQREINRTIIGIETVTQAVAFNAATMGTYMLLAKRHDKEELWRGVVLSLLAGCAIIVASNSYFYHLQKHIGRSSGIATA